MRSADWNMEELSDYMNFDVDRNFNEMTPMNATNTTQTLDYWAKSEMGRPPQTTARNSSYQTRTLSPERTMSPTQTIRLSQGVAVPPFEPDLIRNAYVDAYIQKALYGATIRAIKHQIKAAKRTLSSHPDIYPEDLARMARPISIAERRLERYSLARISLWWMVQQCFKCDTGIMFHTNMFEDVDLSPETL
ncbi:hypothetical protein FRC12_015505 [Ceratobasidium sp. 428]|nr:hypothetical protein FRC12_015505 [Ceratobasidium sp. 428]